MLCSMVRKKQLMCSLPPFTTTKTASVLSFFFCSANASSRSAADTLINWWDTARRTTPKYKLFYFQQSNSRLISAINPSVSLLITCYSSNCHSSGPLLVEHVKFVKFPILSFQHWFGLVRETDQLGLATAQLQSRQKHTHQTVVLHSFMFRLMSHGQSMALHRVINENACANRSHDHVFFTKGT